MFTIQILSILFFVRLFRIGEAHTIVAHVKLGVVFADENVAQDPQGTIWRGDVDAHKAGQADGLAHLCNAENIVLALQLEGLAAKHELDYGETGDQIARNNVLKGETRWINNFPGNS